MSSFRALGHELSSRRSHALVVRGVLAGSLRPVLLLPATSPRDTAASRANRVNDAIASVRR